MNQREEGHRHEQADLHTGHRDTDRACGGGVAADCVDPVADLGALQHVGGQRREQQPPDDGDVQGDGSDLEVVGEDPVQGAEAVHLVDVGAGHRARDELGDAEVGALEDEERPQRDQEAGNARSHDEVAVEEPDAKAEDERQDGADPEVDAELIAEDAVQQAGSCHQDAGGEVELASDHQHAHADRDDADRGGLVEDGEQGRQAAERRRDDEEEDEDDDGRDQARRPPGGPAAGSTD